MEFGPVENVAVVFYNIVYIDLRKPVGCSRLVYGDFYSVASGFSSATFARYMLGQNLPSIQYRICL